MSPRFRYPLNALRGDLSGACVGAITTLPQAVAYGLIAVSPLGPEWAGFGIAASIGSAIFFSLLTGFTVSNPFLIGGPAAMTALVVATAIAGSLGRGLSPETALLLAFSGVVLSGLFQILAGLVRMGRFVSFMPVPVLTGFVTASAVLVFIRSLPTAFGLDSTLQDKGIVAYLMSFNPSAVTISSITIASILLTQGRLKIVPAALAGLIIGATIYFTGHSFFGLPVGPEIGAIEIAVIFKSPLLLDLPGIWAIALEHADIPVLAGLSIALLTSFDTILNSTALESITGKGNKPNRDLITHGAVNMLMGAFGFLPGSGSLARSTAARQAGSKTRLGNVGVGLVFAAMLIILAPVIAELPLWATAGLMMTTAYQAIDRSTLYKARSILLRRVPYRRVLAGDVAVTVLVVVSAVTFDLIVAVGVGIIMAVVLFVLGMGRDPVRRSYRCDRVHSNVVRNDQQIECLETEGQKIAVLELQGAMFFGACSRLHEQARELIDDGVEYLILDFRHLTSIDSSGSSTIRAIHSMYAEVGRNLLISYLEPERRWRRKKASPVTDNDQRLKKAEPTPRWIWLNLDANGVVDAIGKSAILDDTDSAIARCEDLLLTRIGRSQDTLRKGIIAESSLFAGLSRQQILILRNYVDRHRHLPGNYVFNQRDVSTHAYFLISGRMDVLISIPGSSRRRRVSVLTAGALFGEMGMLDGQPRSASVVATMSSASFSINGDAFRRLENDHPALVLIILKNLNRQFAGRLRIANTMISELEQ